MLLFALAAGILVGFLNLVPQKIQDNLHYGSTAALVLLLYSMGAKLGSDRQLMSEIGQIGLQSLGLAVSAIIGSIVPVYLYARRHDRNASRSEQGGARQ